MVACKVDIALLVHVRVNCIGIDEWLQEIQMSEASRSTSDLILGEETRLDFVLAAPILTAFFKEATWPHTHHMSH